MLKIELGLMYSQEVDWNGFLVNGRIRNCDTNGSLSSVGTETDNFQLLKLSNFMPISIPFMRFTFLLGALCRRRLYIPNWDFGR